MSYISTKTDITRPPQFIQAWRTEKGGLLASVWIDPADATLMLTSSADADAMIAAVTQARDALDALEAEGPQQETTP